MFLGSPLNLSGTILGFVLVVEILMLMLKSILPGFTKENSAAQQFSKNSEIDDATEWSLV